MNDRMAIGAIRALREAGIDVPGQVSVVGFDGIEESTCVTPPLTTVIQPLHDLGASAVDILDEIIHGHHPPDRILSCVPAIRESCGCMPRLELSSSADFPADIDGHDRAAIEMLAAEARPGNEDAFIERFNSALAADVVSGRNLDRWTGYLPIVRQLVTGNGDATSAAFAPMFEFSQVLVGRTESRLQAARRVRSEGRSAALRELNATLAGSFEIPVMLERLSAGLQNLGIGGGYLAVFPAPGSNRARLLMSPDGVVESEIAPAPLGQDHPSVRRGDFSFAASELLPARADARWRDGVWVFEPLVFQDEPLGYILLPGGFRDPTVYDAVRDQVASALKGALLLEQVRTHERRLEAEVARRTAALTRANQELTLEIERRTRLEQEVIDISNRTMERIGQDLHDDLSQHLAGVAMLASVARTRLSTSGSDAADSLDQVCTLLEESIARVKQIARGLVPTALQEHGLVAAVEELAASARRGYTAAIDFRASPGFFIGDTERALQVYRIVQEALSNALKHSESERVAIRLHRDESSAMVAEVTDFGSGFSGETSPEGMGLRIMRYRAEKAGLDLRIEQLFPGTRVSCVVPVGNGETK